MLQQNEKKIDHHNIVEILLTEYILDKNVNVFPPFFLTKFCAILFNLVSDFLVMLNQIQKIYIKHLLSNKLQSEYKIKIGRRS